MGHRSLLSWSRGEISAEAAGASKMQGELWTGQVTARRSKPAPGVGLAVEEPAVSLRTVSIAGGRSCAARRRRRRSRNACICSSRTTAAHHETRAAHPTFSAAMQIAKEARRRCTRLCLAGGGVQLRRANRRGEGLKGKGQVPQHQTDRRGASMLHGMASAAPEHLTTASRCTQCPSRRAKRTRG